MNGWPNNSVFCSVKINIFFFSFWHYKPYLYLGLLDQIILGFSIFEDLASVSKLLNYKEIRYQVKYIY
jgi:hypothetical protein